MHRPTPFIPFAAALGCAVAAWGQTPPSSLPLLSGYNAALVSSDLNRASAGGNVVTFDLQLRNTGAQTWFRDPGGAGQTPVRLALSAGPTAVCANVAAWEPAYGWLPRARDRVRLDTPQVAPGETGDFLFSLQLAQNLPPGSYTFRFRPVGEPAGAAGGALMTGEIPITIAVSPRPQSELDFTGLQLYRANLSV